MAAVAFLVHGDAAKVALGPDGAKDLARLGVTNVSLFRDAKTLCVVLEGWAFDASASGDAAAALGARAGTRTLRPVMQSALRAATEED